MRFRHFMRLDEEAPGMAAPPGGGPAAAGLAPPAGTPAGGAPPGAGMGGDPMGGMGAPMGPPMGGTGETPPVVVPKHADVWDVLDHILNHSPLQHDKQLKQQKQQKQQKASQATGGMAPPSSAPGQSALQG